MQIIPSILIQSEEEYTRQITEIQKYLPMIQFDIADGIFVPNTTWDEPDIVEKITDIDIELHLMVKDPLAELTKWSAVEQVKRVIVHYEAVSNLADILPTLHAYGWEIGIAINPDTEIEVLEPYLSEIQAVLFMSVVPGFQGQKLIPEVLEKIKQFKSLHPTIWTEIDGAVNEETLPDVIASGVDAICPGSAISGNGRPIKENIERMQEIINTLT